MKDMKALELVKASVEKNDEILVSKLYEIFGSSEFACNDIIDRQDTRELIPMWIISRNKPLLSLGWYLRSLEGTVSNGKILLKIRTVNGTNSYAVLNIPNIS